MAKASDILCSVRVTLNDEKAERYTDAQLFKFLNEGIDEVRAARPSEAIECISVPLVEGIKQNVPDGFDFVEAIGVEGATADAGIGSTLDETMAKRFGKNPCKAPSGGGGTFTPSAARAVEYDPTGFMVSPPAPAGVSSSIEVAVVANQRAETGPGDDLPLGRNYHAALIDYVLYKAHSIQAESAYHLAQQQFYCDKFYRTLGAGYDGTSRVRSGYNFGAEGSGSPTVGTNRDLRGIR